LSPITHLLVGWELACATRVDARDRALLTIVSVAPDMDGLGLVADLARPLIGLSQTSYYATYHHWLLHGIFWRLFSALIAGMLSSHKLRIFLLSLVVFHLHLLCDLLGSGGPGPDAVWPIYYLGPFSRAMTLEWSGQWQLNAWPNVAFTGVLLFVSGRHIILSGLSPTSLLGHRFNQAFVSTLQAWYGHVFEHS
jgi:inner membrane protein